MRFISSVHYLPVMGIRMTLWKKLYHAMKENVRLTSTVVRVLFAWMSMEVTIILRSSPSLLNDFRRRKFIFFNYRCWPLRFRIGAETGRTLQEW